MYSEDFNLSLLHSLENQVGANMNVFKRRLKAKSANCLWLLKWRFPGDKLHTELRISLLQ